jgi:ABC-2 type transport system ATP-binding protein
MPEVRQGTVFGESLHLLVTDADAAMTIRRRLEAEGITVQEIRPLEPSLEDVFVALLAPGA